jgi:hypothetical protein
MLLIFIHSNFHVIRTLSYDCSLFVCFSLVIEQSIEDYDFQITVLSSVRKQQETVFLVVAGTVLRSGDVVQSLESAGLL